MKLYHVQQPKPFKYQFDGDYKWNLPALKCGTCRKFHGTFLGCPNLDIAGKLEEKVYKSPRTVGRVQYDEFSKPLEDLRTSDMPPLLPGMGFGPFLGRVMHTEKRDFLWIAGRKIAIREDAFQRLAQTGINLENGPAIINDLKTRELRSDYKRILVTKPIKCMARETLEFIEWNECPECGLYVARRPNRIFVKKASIPSGLPLFAIEETESIVGNDEFAVAAKSLKLTNIDFEPVEIV
jgi:hypothetical protein